ncbi:hypothetical protein [Pollutibacter soli]|uniref:hypothetical protein n=1 Tax=Pollutibacter soli TaxID=3034157 RepID=UPI003013F2CC
MIVRPKFPVFIDSVVFEFTQPTSSSLHAELQNEEGSICSKLDTVIPKGIMSYHWSGLDHLPYGIYTLVFSQGGEEHKMQMVKRV